MSKYFKYQACGLKVASELEIPGNPPPADPEAEPDVVVRFGVAPKSLKKEIVSGAAFEAGETDFLLRVPKVANYYVSGGNEIVIDRVDGAEDQDVRVFLLCSAFGVLLQMQGFLPLHASAVQIGDSCVAFAGDSGVGKSTLVAMLSQRGYNIVTDDVCAIKILPGVGPVVYPGFRRLKLWADSLDALKFDRSKGRQLRNRLEKFEFDELPPIERPWVKLRKVYLLNEIRDEENDPKGVIEVEGAARLQALIRNTYRFRYMEGIGAKPAHIRTCAEVVKATGVFHWWRHKNFSSEFLGELEEFEQSWKVTESEKSCLT